MGVTVEIAKPYRCCNSCNSNDGVIEPSNGWGTLDGAIRVLESLRTYIYERAEDVPIDCLWVAW